ncbi:hypothetical protein AK34_5195 [Burkholderia dolosa AU0158]|nr:hypothetical protein AK34_5195 [Burkholderia dolosa AU0158]
MRWLAVRGFGGRGGEAVDYGGECPGTMNDVSFIERLSMMSRLQTSCLPRPLGSSGWLRYRRRIRCSDFL